MPHAALCVSRLVAVLVFVAGAIGFNAARSIVCVETRPAKRCPVSPPPVSMPHAALCVLGQTDDEAWEKKDECFNAARSIVCVGT